MLIGESTVCMQNPEFVKQAFASIASRYVATNHVLSLGIDMLWRQRVVQIVSEWKPERILDLATGTGDLALALQKAMPESEITGSDFCQPMLDIAKKRGLTSLVCADAMNLPFKSGSYDVVTVAFGLRNMESWQKALMEMKRMLKPGGHILILDFSMPTSKIIRPGYRFYLHHVLPGIAGIITGHKEAYDYLAESIEVFPSGNKMLKLMNNTGFLNVKNEPLHCGIASIYHGEI